MVSGRPGSSSVSTSVPSPGVVSTSVVPKVALATAAGGALALTGLHEAAVVALATLVYFGLLAATRAIPQEIAQAAEPVLARFRR